MDNMNVSPKLYLRVCAPPPLSIQPAVTGAGVGCVLFRLSQCDPCLDLKPFDLSKCSMLVLFLPFCKNLGHALPELC